MTRQEKALEYFRNEYNCCRATLMPFADIIDVDEEVLAKVADPSERVSADLGKFAERLAA